MKEGVETVDTHTCVKTATVITHKYTVSSREDKPQLKQTHLQPQTKKQHNNKQQNQAQPQNLYLNNFLTPVKVYKIEPYICLIMMRKKENFIEWLHKWI